MRALELSTVATVLVQGMARRDEVEGFDLPNISRQVQMRARPRMPTLWKPSFSLPTLSAASGIVQKGLVAISKSRRQEMGWCSSCWCAVGQKII